FERQEREQRMAALERGPQHLAVLGKRGRAEERQLQARAACVVHAGILRAHPSAEKRRKRDERSIGFFIAFRRRLHMNTATFAPGARPVLLMLPAMGVAASFYTPFVHTLEQACAATVLMLELPGQGASPLRASSGDDFGYREVVETFIPEAVQRAVAQHPGRPLILAGHSLGGQLALLAAAELKHVVKGLVLIAAGTAHWRAW